jgi:hypothetical protein
MLFCADIQKLRESSQVQADCGFPGSKSSKGKGIQNNTPEQWPESGWINTHDMIHLGTWTSTFQLFWCWRIQGFDTFPRKPGNFQRKL